MSVHHVGVLGIGHWRDLFDSFLGTNRLPSWPFHQMVEPGCVMGIPKLFDNRWNHFAYDEADLL